MSQVWGNLTFVSQTSQAFLRTFWPESFLKWRWILFLNNSDLIFDKIASWKSHNHENHHQCNLHHPQVVVMFSSKLEKEQSNALMEVLTQPSSKLKVGFHWQFLLSKSIRNKTFLSPPFIIWILVESFSIHNWFVNDPRHWTLETTGSQGWNLKCLRAPSQSWNTWRCPSQNFIQSLGGACLNSFYNCHLEVPVSIFFYNCHLEVPERSS